MSETRGNGPILFERSTTMWIFIWFFGLFYFLVRKRYPLAADEEGVTARDGKTRHLWRDATAIYRKKTGGGILGLLLIGGGVDIKFSTGWVGIYPRLYKNGDAVKQQVLAILKAQKGLDVQG